MFSSLVRERSQCSTRNYPYNIELPPAKFEILEQNSIINPVFMYPNINNTHLVSKERFSLTNFILK